MSIMDRLRFCKTCCEPYLYICPRSLARYRTQLKTPREGCGNFVLISARYIAYLYSWTQEYMLKRLLEDDFLCSVVASTFIFAIGIKLSLELNAWDL